CRNCGPRYSSLGSGSKFCALQLPEGKMVFAKMLSFWFCHSIQEHAMFNYRSVARTVLIALAITFLMTGASIGQTIGSPNTVTADPTVPRPNTQPCVVQLFSNFMFADFSPKNFSYTPPANCAGPWAKVVLEA